MIQFTKENDYRPVTFVNNQAYNRDLATQYVDVVSVNKYIGWYQDGGHTEVIQQRLTHFLDTWYQVRVYDYKTRLPIWLISLS